MCTLFVITMKWSKIIKNLIINFIEARFDRIVLNTLMILGVVVEQGLIERDIRQVLSRIPTLVSEIQAEGDGSCEGVWITELPAGHRAAFGHADDSKPAQGCHRFVSIWWQCYQISFFGTDCSGGTTTLSIMTLNIMVLVATLNINDTHYRNTLY